MDNIDVIKEEGRKGYEGWCYLCEKKVARIRDHNWRQHRHEIQTIYKVIDDDDVWRAEVNGEPLPVKPLLGKRKLPEVDQSEPEKRQKVDDSGTEQ